MRQCVVYQQRRLYRYSIEYDRDIRVCVCVSVCSISRVDVYYGNIVTVWFSCRPTV